jgi:hypothetical protein
MALYEAYEGKVVLADAESLNALRKEFVRLNETWAMCCPNITCIRVHIDEETYDLPKQLVSDFINDLCNETDFLPCVEEL